MRFGQPKELFFLFMITQKQKKKRSKKFKQKNQIASWPFIGDRADSVST